MMKVVAVLIVLATCLIPQAAARRSLFRAGQVVDKTSKRGKAAINNKNSNINKEEESTA
jgi:hypothetical protein